MRILAAMSGGVDSSVAAALLVEEGHDVVGVTLKLWGGPSDSGCCSVSDVEDARRVAQQLGIDHWVFSFTEEFEERVVEPYARGHAIGQTPNPCIECNRHLKFDRLLRRADQLGFDAVATGHHARILTTGGRHRLLRGADRAKDQSYVLYMLGQAELARCRFPVGEITKTEVREKAATLNLRTADKPDSQDVCFITASGGRADFLGPRIGLHPGRVVDGTGATVGTVDAVELVTVGQRRGLSGGGGERRYAISVDPSTATVVAGGADDLLTDRVDLRDPTWVDTPVHGPVEAQCSAHGEVAGGGYAPGVADRAAGVVRFAAPHRRVAPGQSVVLYRGDDVLGGGIAL